jgi:hypothetical protein
MNAAANAAVTQNEAQPNFGNIVDPPPLNVTEAGGPGNLFSWQEIQISTIIFIFAIIALILFYIMVKNERATPFILRIYVIVILVFGTLFVVSASYNTQLVAPVIGFFGTIAGYLLGRSDRANDA